jgi:hypothetical protein
MEFDEFRQRLEAARARAALRRLQAVEVLANNEDLRRENAEAFSRTSARRRGRDAEIRRQPDAVPPTDPQQHHP